jgi:hypothetical protein
MTYIRPIPPGRWYDECLPIAETIVDEIDRAVAALRKPDGSPFTLAERATIIDALNRRALNALRSATLESDKED